MASFLSVPPREACQSGDAPLQSAIAQITEGTGSPRIAAFFDSASSTVSYVVTDVNSGEAAIVDSVLDYDAVSGRIDTVSADAIARHILEAGLTVRWHLETHIHADHLSAAHYLKDRLGGNIAAGTGVLPVQTTVTRMFALSGSNAPCASDFDTLLADGDCVTLGSLTIRVLHVPGHTPADIAFVIGDVLFVGDTLFMPDFGTGRTDFPGGDADQLYQSIQRLLALPEDSRLFLCHDYKAPGRDEYRWECTVGEQRANNIHIQAGQEAFVAMRNCRDEGLAFPALYYAAIQVNVRAGRLPKPERNGRRYLKMPLAMEAVRHGSGKHSDGRRTK